MPSKKKKKKYLKNALDAVSPQVFLFALDHSSLAGSLHSEEIRNLSSGALMAPGNGLGYDQQLR
jgi:hypothetical protein